MKCIACGKKVEKYYKLCPECYSQGKSRYPPPKARFSEETPVVQPKRKLWVIDDGTVRDEE